MVESLRHRGPDGSGSHASDTYALGHTRLAIIDLPGGTQPMTDGHGLWIVYNGEVYNYASLRKELEGCGQVFLTNSDTEVVLKAYAQWGPRAVNRFDGIFAFAIGDDRSGELFLARDMFGIKPLYYEVNGDTLIFGSEMKAILATPFADRTPDMSGLPHFLAFGIFPREMPPFANLKTLPPASYAVWRSGQLNVESYWSASEAGTYQRSRRPTEDDLRELRDEVRSAVTRQLVSDVPIGVLLSGGIDSGLIACALHSRAGETFPAFTVIFPTAESREEVRLASELAARHHLEHHVIEVGAKELSDRLVELLAHFDEPYADTSAIPTYVVSRFARQHVKVALSGDGGDETWGGYGAYRRFLQVSVLQRLLRGDGRVLSAAARSARAVGLPAGAQRLLSTSNELVQLPVERVYPALQAHTSGEQLAALIGRPVDALDWSDLGLGPARDGRRLTLHEIMLNNLEHSLVDDMLKKVDMMSMAVGLEVRVPMLARSLVAQALEWSWRTKVSWRQTKVLLRKVAATELPAGYLAAKKQGFSFGHSLDDALRGSLKDLVHDTLVQPSRAGDLLAPDAVQAIVHEHMQGASYGRLLICMMALQTWADSYL